MGKHSVLTDTINCIASVLAKGILTVGGRSRNMGAKAALMGDVREHPHDVRLVRTSPGQETSRGAHLTAELIAYPTLVTVQPSAVTQSCRALSTQRVSLSPWPRMSLEFIFLNNPFILDNGPVIPSWTPRTRSDAIPSCPDTFLCPLSLKHRLIMPHLSLSPWK